MKLSILFILFLVVFSCNSPKPNLIEFDPRLLEENGIKLSEIAEDISYIPLDNKFPLGIIYDKIEFINNSVYLSEKDNGVLSFNRNGELIKKFGSKGRGPGEYVANFLFTVDEITGSIYILDVGDEIKVYSKSGNYLRSFSLREFGNQIDEIEYFNSQLFVSYELQNETNKNKWICVDTLGSLIFKQERKDLPFSSRAGGAGGTYKFENRLSYWNTFFTDTVYSIFPDLSEKPSFIISPGEHRRPKSYVLIPIEDLDNYLSIDRLLETKRFLMISYFFKGKNEFALINKESLDSYQVGWGFNGRGGILNDIDGGTGFLPRNYFVENNREYIVGLIDPFQIKTIVASNEFKNFDTKFPEKKKELEILANSLEESDNPVLMIVRLKE
jgi:hypothetical protein